MTTPSRSLPQHCFKRGGEYMDDYRWLRLAQQKADEYQTAAKRYALASSHQTRGAETPVTRPGFRGEAVKVFLRLATKFSPDTTHAETRRKGRR